VATDADDDATMFYTSGTTGRPKGAVGTHRNAITNVMNLFYASQREALRYPPDADEGRESFPSAFLLNVPLFHADRMSLGDDSQHRGGRKDCDDAPL